MAEINSFQIGSVTYDMRDERTKQNLASVFSTGVAYEAGDYAEYDTQLYQFIVDHPAGAWDASQVMAVNLAAGVSEALKGGKSSSTKAPVIINSASGDIASFADGADGMPIKKLVGMIEPMQSGSGDPSPDNVRPISGWTGCEINVTGINAYDLSKLVFTSGYMLQKDTGAIVSNQYYKTTVPFYPCKQLAGRTIITNIIGSSASGNYPSFAFYTDAVEGTCVGTYARGQSATLIINVPATAKYMRITMTSGSDINTRYILFGNTIPSPVPEFGTTLPINWQTEAGTIYGGTITLNEDGSVDVVSDRATITFDGSENWSLTAVGTRNFNVYIDRIFKSARASQLISDMFRYQTSGQEDFGWMWLYSNTALSIADGNSVFATVAEFKAWVAEHNFTICGLLATPQTYHFDNIGQLYTYFGTNNIWINTGTITECDYPADTKLYIDGLTAPDEDMIADANIASGKYFVVNNQLYLSTAAIAAGASIIPGTNCTATNIAAALNAINT